MVDKKRPVNLDLGTIRLPITSYVSILHRISGVITFFGLAVMLWLLDLSLDSEQSFNMLKDLVAHPAVTFFVWGSLIALAYHTVTGIRHLVMDFGLGEENFNSGRISAWIAVALSLLVILVITSWVLSW
jgi:succinate dehydrogenase / fumarate reductase, cytochrome b subunit